MSHMDRPMAAERYRVKDRQPVDDAAKSGAGARGTPARRAGPHVHRVRDGRLADNAAIGGMEVPGSSARGPSRAGTAHLVQALSQKLAGQRKMLDEMSVQKAQSKSTWKWWHVVGLVLLNNLLAVGFGFGSGSVFYGVSTWGEDGISVDSLNAEGMIVTVNGAQRVILTNTAGAGHVQIEAGEGSNAELRFADADGTARFAMEATGHNEFAITQTGESRIRIVREELLDHATDQPLRTDILLNIPGELCVGGELCVDDNTLRTKGEKSMTLRGNGDVVLDPSEGTVRVESSFDMEKMLSVGDSLLVVDPSKLSVQIGKTSRPAGLTAHSPAWAGGEFTISKGLTVNSGNILMGNVAVSVAGDLSATGGEILLCTTKDDALRVRGDVSVLDPTSEQHVIYLSSDTGDIVVGAISY